MSSVTDEQNVDVADSSLSSRYSSTSHSIGNETQSQHPTVNVHALLDQLFSVVHQRLDDGQKSKNLFVNNGIQPAFYQVLCEIKERIGKIRVGQRSNECFESL